MPKMKNEFNMGEFKKIAKKFRVEIFWDFRGVVFKDFRGFC